MDVNLASASAVSASDLHPRYQHDFDEQVFIGGGGYGTVFSCKHTLDTRLYAVKKIPHRKSKQENVMNEVIVLSTLHHPYVIRYHQAWIEEGMDKAEDGNDYDCEDDADADADADADTDDNPYQTLFIQMELCERTLEGMLQHSSLSIPEIWNYFRQIVEGLHHVHVNNFVHGDLSTINILLGFDKNLKLADFGLAKNMTNSIIGNKEEGHLLYLPPEVLREEELSARTDVYSLGLILVEMVLKIKTAHQKFPVFQKIKEMEISSWGDNILYRMLDQSPNTRPTAGQILDISDEDAEGLCEELKSEIQSRLGRA